MVVPQVIMEAVPMVVELVHLVAMPLHLEQVEVGVDEPFSMGRMAEMVIMVSLLFGIKNKINGAVTLFSINKIEKLITGIIKAI